MQTPVYAENDPYQVVGSPEHVTTDVRVLKSGDTFLVVSPLGNVARRPQGEHGLYHRGTRHLSRYRVQLGRRAPLLLRSSVHSNNTMLSVDVANQDILDENGAVTVRDGTLHLSRSALIAGDVYRERLTITNYGQGSVRFDLHVDFAADFADIFEVRGATRERRGQSLDAALTHDVATLLYHGLDDVRRCTVLYFSPVPDQLSEASAEFSLQLEHGETRNIEVAVHCTEGSTQRQVSFEAALLAATDAARSEEGSECNIVSSNQKFNEWVERSRSDLKMLVTATPHGRYPYAGVPWFSTVFGRDGIIAALQTLWIAPELAQGVLRLLSAHQAEFEDPEVDAEPGKILHELREGEMAALKEIPFGRYYGSVDSTPLYLMLAHAYYGRTGDVEFIRSIWPQLLRAGRWLEDSGDSDGDGFVEYGRRSNHGLVHQGWKDSCDSVFHDDGRPAEAPIALCEVQGYVFAAQRGMQSLAQALGDEAASRDWGKRAEAMQSRFDEKFWCADLETYALALDGHKEPCRVRTSNAAHCLFSGIALAERADSLARSLMTPQMFSGWGIRTLSTEERCFNPMSYHNGSVWPHDSAIAARGLALYGYKQHAMRILSGLFDASQYLEGCRLPELFCGFARDGGPPTRYPVACSPQAWASGAVYLLLQSVLGVEVDAVTRRLIIDNPLLPEFIERLDIARLPVAGARVDITFWRENGATQAKVSNQRGQIEVVCRTGAPSAGQQPQWATR